MAQSSTVTRGPAAWLRGLRRWPIRAWRDTPATTYYALLSLIALLVILGLVMVFSASSANSIAGGKSPYGGLWRQLAFVAVGVVAATWAARRPPATWQRLAIPLLLVAVLGEMLVLTPLGADDFQGNRNWLQVGPIKAQPSELGKLALVLSGALILNVKRPLMDRLSHLVVPFLAPVALLVIGPVMLGRDLGTALVMGAIVIGLVFAVGIRIKWFAWGMAGLSVLLLVAVRTSGNRMERISVWLDPGQCRPDTSIFYGSCRQPMHGLYALADGGWLGVGLGGSREKWGWLSASSDDFIFAVIGEELGLLGTLTVLALFAGVIWVALRIVHRAQDPFVGLTTVGILVWLLAQAVVNIGAVIGALPVIGVPLPFISAGGSSMITSLLAAGILLSFVRDQPQVRQEVATHQWLRRLLRQWRTGRSGNAL